MAASVQTRALILPRMRSWPSGRWALHSGGDVMARSRARTLRIRQYREELIAEIGLLSIAEAARALRRRREFVTELIDAGRLRCVVWGRQRRIRVADLEQFLAQMSAPQLPAPDPRLRHRAPPRTAPLKFDQQVWDQLS